MYWIAVTNTQDRNAWFSTVGHGTESNEVKSNIATWARCLGVTRYAETCAREMPAAGTSNGVTVSDAVALCISRYCPPSGSR